MIDKDVPLHSFAQEALRRWPIDDDATADEKDRLAHVRAAFSLGCEYVYEYWSEVS